MAWKAFEELIATIQRQTAPTATVRHNHVITGRSGHRRQLDVTLSTRVGLNDVFIVIECKLYRRPVGIEKVEAFASKLGDVNASQGAMISPAGFTRGAQSVAQKFNIGLWSYRAAVEADWQAVMGPNAWATFTISTVEDLAGLIRLKEPGLEAEEGIILDERGQKLYTLAEIKDPVGEKMLLLPPGFHIMRVASNLAQFARVGSRLIAVDAVYIEARNRAREYIFNLHLGGGHVLQRTVPAAGSFRGLHSQTWQPQEIIRMQQGRDLSVEEWKRNVGPPPPGYRAVINHIVGLSLRMRFEVIHDDTGESGRDAAT